MTVRNYVYDLQEFIKLGLHSSEKLYNFGIEIALGNCFKKS